jgi:hypothetical protein
MLHTVEEDRWFVENMILNECEVTVAEGESGIVSFLARNGEAIRLLYTHPACIGSAAGTQLIEAATARGTAALELWCFQANLRPRRFCEARDFRAVRFTNGENNKERMLDVRYRRERGPGRHPLTFTASDGTMRLAKLALHASAVSHWAETETALALLAFAAFSDGETDSTFPENALWRRRLLVDGLQLVAVEIDHEGGVIGGAILRSWAGGAAIRGACLDSCGVKSIDRFAARRNEGKVKARPWSSCLPGLWKEGELVRPAFFPKADAVWICPDADISKRGKNSVIERGCAIEVIHTERQVTEHRNSSSFRRRGIRLRLVLVDDQQVDGARRLAALVLVAMDRSARDVGALSPALITRSGWPLTV